MAPKVQVPCDFGREYINVPEHCNLTLKLQNGEDYLVNSVLMSYNSPEIKRLTTELHQTSLAMDDFDEKAVYCFVDSLYTGDIEMMNTGVFTEVFKMGQVFEVAWLLNRLSGYFENLVIRRDTVNSSSNDAVYRNVKSLFEMATIILSQGSKKQHVFIDIFINSLIEKGDKSKFVTRFISEIDLNELAKSRVEQILQMVGDESDILVEGLLKSFRNYPYNRPLSEELKYLLNVCNLASCYHKRRELFNELFEMLDGIESLTKDDLRFLNRINRQCLNEISNLVPNDQNPASSKGVEFVAIEQRSTKVDMKPTTIRDSSSTSHSVAATDPRHTDIPVRRPVLPPRNRYAHREGKSHASKETVCQKQSVKRTAPKANVASTKLTDSVDVNRRKYDAPKQNVYYEELNFSSSSLSLFSLKNRFKFQR